MLSCWLLLMALGLDGRVGIAGAAAVLFAVNVTAVMPATPANIGVFQAACVAVLAGAYHVSTPDALAYGIVLQVVELATAVLMGIPALITEGLSWKDVRLRTMSGAPVKLSPLPAGARAGSAKGAPSGLRGRTRLLGGHRRLVLGFDRAVGRVLVVELAEQRGVAGGAPDHVVGRAVGQQAALARAEVDRLRVVGDRARASTARARARSRR